MLIQVAIESKERFYFEEFKQLTEYEKYCRMFLSPAKWGNDDTLIPVYAKH